MRKRIQGLLTLSLHSIAALCTATISGGLGLSSGPGLSGVSDPFWTRATRTTENNPSTHSGEWCLKYAVWQTHLLIPLVIMSKRNRASPTARRGGDSSQWDTIARFAGTTPRSRTSSGAKFHEPTSKPLRCWIFDAHYYPFPEWSLVILTSTTTPGGVCVPGK